MIYRDWTYENWPSGEPYSWGGARRGMSAWDQYDFHVDLGCGAHVKKGRIGVDVRPAPGVNVLMNLDTLDVHAVAPKPGDDAFEMDGETMILHGKGGLVMPTNPRVDLQLPVLHNGLPFGTSSIKSIVSHHCLEHIGAGFIPLIDEIYRVLEPGGIFRAITPLFPSRSAIDDPTHIRMFTESTWEFCCGKPNETHWMESFSVPYTKARFKKVDQDVTALFPPAERWTDNDVREIRVALEACK